MEEEAGRKRLELYLQETGVKIPFDWVESDYPCIISRRAIENIEQELEKGIIYLLKGTKYCLFMQIPRV